MTGCRLSLKTVAIAYEMILPCCQSSYMFELRSNIIIDLLTKTTKRFASSLHKLRFLLVHKI